MEHQGSFLQEQERVSGLGRGRGRGSNCEVAAELVSWNPSWLSGVSPPSFGPAASGGQGTSVIGRGRANLIASALSQATLCSEGGSGKVKSARVPYGDSSESESSGDEMKQLQRDHLEWRQQMDMMAEKGRQLEEAMDNLMKKKKKGETETRRDNDAE